MKRTIKNIVMCLLAALLCCSIAFTFKSFESSNESFSDKEISQNEPSAMPNGGGGEGEEPPAMPSGGDGEGKEPPAMPNGGGGEGEEPSEMSDANGSKGQEPPEKPEDGEFDKDAASSNAKDALSKPEDATSGEEQPPEIPENGEMASNVPDMPESESHSFKWAPCILFAIENLLLISILLYLILSFFNKKSFKEAFSGKGKTAISVVAVIVVSAALTFAEYSIAENITSSDKPEGQGGAPGAQESVSYSAENELTESSSVSDQSFESDQSDQVALLVSGKIDVTASQINVEKTGDSDGGDATSFYGTNSAILAKDGASLTLDNIEVSTNATGANGVFCYGGSATTDNDSQDGTTVTISNSKIVTSKDNSGGIMTTGGGTTNASNLDIETSGISSAAIRTDRGGGVVNVDGGTYSTTGKGSPAIYSTADVKAANADLSASTSEGIVIEGKNSVSIENCRLDDDNTELNGLSTTYKNIFLYQSMSGDAAEGNASFTAKDSEISTGNGDTFYVTNTSASIYLEGNDFANAESDGCFLRVQKDSWGNEGSNGGDVSLELVDQIVVGDIVIDEISTLSMKINGDSSFEGAINTDNSAESIDLSLDSTSSLKLTGDTYVTSFQDADETFENVDFNGFKLYVNGKAIN